MLLTQFETRNDTITEENEPFRYGIFQMPGRAAAFVEAMLHATISEILYQNFDFATSTTKSAFLDKRMRSAHMVVVLSAPSAFG